MQKRTLRCLWVLWFVSVVLTGILVVGLAKAGAQTLYNPPAVTFESADHATVTLYRVEYWIAGQPLVGAPVGTWDVAKSLITVENAGPPVTYKLLLKDVYVFLPFGKSYVLRLLACQDTLCSSPSEVTRETVRYTYCKGTDTTVKPLTIVQPAPPIGAVGKYVAINLATTSVTPVHAISISLVGSGLPAYYFTGNDMRGSIVLSVGPLPRAGRYLMNISAADEMGCSTSQATQYLTVR